MNLGGLVLSAVASGHTDLPGGPVYLWIMLYKPHVSKDDDHSANTHDMEGGSFQMIPVLDHEVHDFGDVTSIVEGPIHVVDRDGSREILGVQVLGPDIV